MQCRAEPQAVRSPRRDQRQAAPDAAPAPLLAADPAAAAIWSFTLCATEVQATVPIAATPIEPPTCWPMLSRLDAAPASSFLTCKTTISVSGTNMRPMPTLSSYMGASRLVQ